MMPWYVFALVDTPPKGAKGKGLSGSLGLRRVPGGYAVVERRADVPPAEFGPLQRHQEVVARLAARVPAILPVRFGTLLDDEAIEEALAERGPEIAEALDAVRNRVQFTWRRRPPSRSALRRPGPDPRFALRRPGPDPRSALRRPGPDSRSALRRAPSTLNAGEPSGAEYLRRAARAAKPLPPPAWRSLRGKLAPFVAAERYQPATATAPESLYHLVGRDAVARYTTLGTALTHAQTALTMTGPWPPFAFAGEGWW
jgi:hypothetical protein